MNDENNSWFSKKEKFIFEEDMEKLPEKPTVTDYTGEIDVSTGAYTELFDANLDYTSDISETYERLQKERRRRVELALENAGVDAENMEEEFGIIAPIPVTAEKANVEATQKTEGFQKALEETANSDLIELKFNVANENLELKRSVQLEETIESEIAKSHEEIDEIALYQEKTLPAHVINIDLFKKSIEDISSVLPKKTEEVVEIAKKISETKREKTAETKEYSDDYLQEEQSSVVAENLAKSMKRHSKHFVILAGMSFIMLIINIVYENIFSYGNQEGDATMFIIINLIFLCASIALSFKSFISGIKTLFKFKANEDAAVALASLAVFVQCFMALFHAEYILTGYIHIYAVVVVVAWCLSNLGKLTRERRIDSNFKYLISNEQKYIVNRYNNHAISADLTKDCLIEEPVVVYQKKTKFLKNFLKISYEKSVMENKVSLFAQISFAVSLLVFIIVLLRIKDYFVAVSMFSATVCIAMPIANLFAINFNLNKICNKVRIVGGFISGFRAISKFEKANTIMLSSSEIFTSGNIKVENINFFDCNSKGKTIMYATSLLRKMGGSFSDIAVQIDENYDAEQVEVENYVVEYEKGFSAAVQGHNVLIGTRGLMFEHGVKIPDANTISENEKSLVKKTMCIAVDKEIKAIVSLVYSVDTRKTKKIKEMEASGVNLVLHNTDPNVNKEMLASLCGINPASLTVIGQELSQVYEDLVAKTNEKEEAFIATKGRVESIITVICQCIRHRKLLNVILAIQTVGIIMGMLVVFLMSSLGAVSQISASAIIVFTAFWAIISSVVIKFKPE